MIQAMIRGLAAVCNKRQNAAVLVVDDAETMDALGAGRVVDVGISECNAAGAAAGMASAGMMVYVVACGSFMACRALDFVRDQVCMQNRNVKVLGIGAGFAISALGSTQHSTEDLGVLRALPNLIVMTASTPTEAERMVVFAAERDEPCYIRIGRACGEDFYLTCGVQFEPFKAQELQRGEKIAILATGTIVCDALEAAKELSKQGVNAGVVNVHTLSPLDTEGIAALAARYDVWVTVEEHSVSAGLGGAAAEVIAEKELRVELVRMGLHGAFAKGHGTHTELKRLNGLGVEDMVRVCKKAVSTA